MCVQLLLSVENRDAFSVMIEAFLRAVAEDTEVPIPPAETRNVLRMILATKESIETGKTVCL